MSKRESTTSKQQTNKIQVQKRDSSKTELAAALSNVSDDVKTQEANLRIEQLLNESLLQPEAKPIIEEEPISLQEPPLAERQSGGDVEQFAEKIVDQALEQSIIITQGKQSVYAW